VREKVLRMQSISYSQDSLYFFYKIISTHLLTVLTIGCITQIVNRKIEIKEISKKTHDGSPSFDIDVQFGPQLNKREEDI
jgi:hypothetical protein